ncbi:OmpA family protein [Avibacterium avium]|uniref:OmpA family protein n=1 Tax=Avibacterium avium TaxID=751 RepID=UPI003BF7E919
MKLTHKKILIWGAITALSACSNLDDVNHVWCPPNEPHKPNVEQINLSADALFKFNQSSLNELLPAGRKQLDQLAEKLSNDYISVEKIKLIGHTDRLGDEQYNYELGLKRAQTVKHYLLAHHIKGEISVSSNGEMQPTNITVNNCQAKMSIDKLKTCLQPDRRVEVIIQGVKSQKVLR